MRQIKFRAKDLEGHWICGYYTQGYIHVDNSWRDGDQGEWWGIPVDENTVGQFTGLTDKNGKEIYEGDILQDKNGICVIMWFQTSWGIASYAHGYNGIKSYTAVDSFYSKETKEWTVIGSIHDNPELLT